jgi:dTDP-4-dehydrorhamnose 3,5-epimerase
MDIKTLAHKKFITNGYDKEPNGYLVPLYNVHDGFFEKGKEPQQVYLTTVLPGKIKGPHLHFIRTGAFTCIKGNVRVVLKLDTGYKTVYSGEEHDYLTIIIPTGVPAALQCLGDTEAMVLNMPSPAWTPTMNDEHTASFDDYDFTQP